MTKAEVVSKISAKTGVEKTTTLAIVESFMNEVMNSVSENESVFLRDLGHLKQRRGHKKQEEISRRIPQ